MTEQIPGTIEQRIYSPLFDCIEFLNKVDEVKECENLIDTFSKYSNNKDQYLELARCYNEIKSFDKAIKFAEKSLIMTVDNLELLSIRANLSKLYNLKNDPEKSLFYSNQNYRIDPTDYDTRLERMFSYFLLNQKDKSEAILREMIKEDLPLEVKQRVLFNLGTYDLYKGEFKKGLKGCILRGKELGIWKDIQMPFEKWFGGTIENANIIIVAEGGIGDELINFRFMKHFIDRGMNPIWLTSRKDVASIIKRSGYKVISNINELDRTEKYYWTTSIPLPVYLDLSEDELWYGNYITASEESINKFKYIENSIGIKCSGNPFYDHSLHRSVPLDDMQHYLPLDKNWVSLHIDESLDHVNIQDILMKGIHSFEDTLGLIYNLDYVVTSCTSVAHAAAAMGKKVFILVPITAYYTWASNHDTSSIWYGDNVTVLRQVKHKSWKEPLEQLAYLLDENRA